MTDKENAEADGQPAAKAEPIDGGEITDLDADLPKFDDAKHRAETASRLAFWLLGILAGSWLLYYVAVLILGCAGKKEPLEILSLFFDKWLPVISGFVGGAITYYFTRDKQ